MNVKDINKKNLNKILRWCKENYGGSKFKRMGSLKVVIDNSMDAAGAYCTIQNTIFVNPKYHDSFIGIVDTMIHEYTHFRQDINVMYFKYFREYNYSYDRHPYEITARETAARDKRKCFRDVFHKRYRKSQYI